VSGSKIVSCFDSGETVSRVDDTPLSDPKARQPAILIVEDEVLIRMSLGLHLEECGFAVLEASNAAEAVQIIKSPPLKIDLVFSDVRMPGEMDGAGLAKWVKANFPYLPIFLASADSKKVELAKELCAHEAFFSKPYDVKKVVEQIRQILAAHKAAN
jgi:CheY-like chemotaxis protein